MLSLSCIIRYASNLRKSVEIFENLTLLLEKKTRWFIIRIKRAAVQGYTYDVAADDMDNYTKLVLDEIDKSTEGFAWWEAKMPSEISKTAQENVQPLLNGEMTGEEYMQSIQDVYDMQ